MAQIERKIKITYRWWNNNLDEIDSKHVEALEESAQERIHKQMEEGNTGGSLSDTIRMYDSDGEDGIEYEGWWEMTTVNS